MPSLKYMARSNLELQEEVLQMLLENLEEVGILENGGDDSNQCFYLINLQKVIQRKEKQKENDTPTRILEMLTPFLNKNICGDIKELDYFFDRQAIMFET